MSDRLEELRRAWRALRRSPGFTFAALASLGLGIGANTAIFSVVDGVLLRPAPYAEIDRVAMIWETDRHSGTVHEPASVPDYLDFQRLSRSFEQLAAFSPTESNLTPDSGDPARLAALQISHEFLPMVGLRPILGRGFSAEEDRTGGAAVVVLGEGLWQRQFDRDPEVVGRTIRLDDVARTVIGVLPREAEFGMRQILGSADYMRGFADRGGRAAVDVYLPLQPDPEALPRSTHPIFVAGRLAPGADVGSAQREMTSITADLERSYSENDGRGAHVQPLSSVVFGKVRPALLALLGSVALVLLASCTNVASLLLARGASREREIGVRTALGAGLARLTRQFLVESAVLTALGAIIGVVVAWIGLRLLLALAPADIPRLGSIGIDATVLAVTLAVSAVVGLVFGLLPTLQARRLDLRGSLQRVGGRGSSAGARRSPARSILVVAELGLAVTLMVGAGLLIRSLWQLRQVDPGFRTAEVVQAEYQLPESRYPRNFAVWPRWTEQQRFNDELRRRIAALPGVEAVTLATSDPLDPGFTSSIRVVGREAEAADWPEPAIRLVAPGYFATLGVPVRAGRPLADSDDADAAPVLLVNEAARRRFFADRDPLGQRIRLWGAERTVVGVVGDERFRGLDQASPPAVYLSLSQAPSATGSYSLLFRAAGGAARWAPALRSVIRELDPALPLFGIESLDQTLSGTLAQRRFTMLVLICFAGLALLLAAAGVHGVLTYTVAERRRELGIRMALGADAGRVRALVVGQGVRLAAAGLAAGFVGAVWISRLVSSLLFGVRAADPSTYVGVVAVLGAVALVACYLPAHRASRVQPAVALRND